MATTEPATGARARWDRFGTWLEYRTDRELFLIVFTPLLAIYLAINPQP